MEKEHSKYVLIIQGQRRGGRTVELTDFRKHLKTDVEKIGVINRKTKNRQTNCLGLAHHQCSHFGVGCFIQASEYPTETIRKVNICSEKEGNKRRASSGIPEYSLCLL